jgi:hypothetical protein
VLMVIAWASDKHGFFGRRLETAPADALERPPVTTAIAPE